MSGPKVVRIVTREELIAICEGHIATLRAALEQWQKVGLRNELIDSEDIRLAERRVAAMRDLLAADSFAEIQKQVPQEIAYLKTDMSRRIERAVEEKAQVRNEDRRRVRAAEALGGALAAKGIDAPAALLSPGTQKAEDLQVAIATAFKLLGSSLAESDGPTEHQRQLAAKLTDDNRLTLAEWLAGQPDAKNNNASDMLELERRLDELQALDPVRGQMFAVRHSQVSADFSPRRSLLIDSLATDIAKARWDAITEANAWEELDAVFAQLEAVSGLQPELLSKVDGLRTSAPQVSEIKELTSRVREEAERTMKVQAEMAKRRAVMEGLSELGYAVKEGMQTAWVENGRVVLKSSKSPQYGVEIGGDPNSNMQLRTVRFDGVGSATDVAADVAAETEFCGDFSKLQARVAADGGELLVVKALGVGATPVKRVASEVRLEDVQKTVTNAPAASRKL
ncbi:hypothetical protein [Rhizobium leguminosarum]|uniref:hypothetical protein n=1 Tax=Rhizobium leguminosarum TaxID=384 RepID=UPI003D086FC2